MAEDPAPYFTPEGFPLRIVCLEYLSPTTQFPERAISVLFNDRTVIVVNSEAMSGLMQEPKMARYRDLLGNIIHNEQEHWFAGENPRVSASILI